jgi:hypothetical protein
MMNIRRIGWIPPLVELVGAICTFLSLKLVGAQGVSYMVSDGSMKKAAAIYVLLPTLATVGLVLIGVGLIFQAVIEFNKRR